MAGADPKDRAEYHERQLRELKIRIDNLRQLVERHS